MALEFHYEKTKLRLQGFVNMNLYPAPELELAPVFGLGSEPGTLWTQNFYIVRISRIQILVF
mgnify:CR=1 FL=1